jgi:hypothetical protein
MRCTYDYRDFPSVPMDRCPVVLTVVIMQVIHSAVESQV